MFSLLSTVRIGLAPTTRIIGTRPISSANSAALTAWTEHVLATPSKQRDTITPTLMLKLFYTLPTRSGPVYSTPPPTSTSPLPPGHHLVLFPPLMPESALNPDGTEPSFNPPLPFTRRMWAAGEMQWVDGNDLTVGEEVELETVVEKVERKGWDGQRPKVFVWQKRTVSNANGVAIIERRAHVFQPPPEGGEGAYTGRKPAPTEGLPDPDFSLSYTPTAMTLFRFSALTFNSHKIHYDPLFCQTVDGQPERLVHAPFTALMLLEGMNFSTPPSARLASFAYRATRPMIVDRPVRVCGALKEGSKNEFVLWAENELGEVAMTGSAVVSGITAH